MEGCRIGGERARRDEVVGQINETPVGELSIFSHPPTSTHTADFSPSRFSLLSTPSILLALLSGRAVKT